MKLTKKARDGSSLQVEIHDQLTVMSGRNGVGKSRMLADIKKGAISVERQGSSIQPAEIALFSRDKLLPVLGVKAATHSLDRFVSETLALYERLKESFDSDYKTLHERSGESESYAGLPYKSLYRLVRDVSAKYGTLPSEIDHGLLKLHIRHTPRGEIGHQSLAILFNDYLWLRHKNREQQIMNIAHGTNVPTRTAEQFSSDFGSPPWERLNEILNEVFSGKFSVQVPNDKLLTYQQDANLLMDSGEVVNESQLSDGEKTLLWLVIALFNAQSIDPIDKSYMKLLLLDEPDAYLHPRMVEILYRALDRLRVRFDSAIVIVTHSPTTVALAPAAANFIMDGLGVLKAATPDEAISELLDGITRIAIDPHNRRQVFVESFYDAQAFEALYLNLSKNGYLDNGVTLTFSASGARTPVEHIRSSIKAAIPECNENQLNDAAVRINGGGNCIAVYAAVEALTTGGNRTVRGIVDWDAGRNEVAENVTVLAAGCAYAIDNILIDPLAVALCLSLENPSLYPLSAPISEWLASQCHKQGSADWFVMRIFGRPSKQDASLTYADGTSLTFDSEYLASRGHDMEDRVLKEFPCLKSFARRSGELKLKLVERAMIGISEGKLIPSSIIDAMATVQK